MYGLAGAAANSQGFHTTTASLERAEVEPPRLRTEFPETWLWENIDVNR